MPINTVLKHVQHCAHTYTCVLSIAQLQTDLWNFMCPCFDTPHVCPMKKLPASPKELAVADPGFG